MHAPPTQPPCLVSEVPGPRSRALARRLGVVEGRNVTCLDPVPIFWERAAGANVWDVDGNRYVDLVAAFGVSNAGHGHPRIAEAIARQAARLLHGMGDVQPSEVKVELLEALVRRFPGGGPARAVLGSSGSDAIETALKTVQLVTGRPGMVAFVGSYHGLSLGALDVTWRPGFREPFAERLAGCTAFARFGEVEDVQRAARDGPSPVGGVIVEPIQGRGGERVPPRGFLAELRSLCDREGWLLVVDEIYTGFGRTGRWFACEHEGVVPDLLCVGKGLASGMPISACLGRREVMEAWPESTGEALHTQTFLGHPAGCAAALACLAILEDEKLVEQSAELGESSLEWLSKRLDGHAGVSDVRGRGLMIGIECRDPVTAATVIHSALRRGLILLASGDDARVVSLTPPLCIGREPLAAALEILADCIP